MKLQNGRTFGYRREALYPDELTVNGADYALKLGRVFVLKDDGTLEQLPIPVSLDVAKNPEELGKVLAVKDGSAASTPVDAEEPAALFSPVADPSLGELSYRLVSTLTKPRHVVVAELSSIDERYSVSHHLPQISFYLAAPEEADSTSCSVTWSLEKVTEGEGS